MKPRGPGRPARVDRPGPVVVPTRRAKPQHPDSGRRSPPKPAHSGKPTVDDARCARMNGFCRTSWCGLRLTRSLTDGGATTARRRARGGRDGGPLRPSQRAANRSASPSERRTDALVPEAPAGQVFSAGWLDGTCAPHAQFPSGPDRRSAAGTDGRPRDQSRPGSPAPARPAHVARRRGRREHADAPRPTRVARRGPALGTRRSSPARWAPTLDRTRPALRPAGPPTAARRRRPGRPASAAARSAP